MYKNIMLNWNLFELCLEFDVSLILNKIEVTFFQERKFKINIVIILNLCPLFSEFY